jgi:hypothetical protein
LKVQRVLNAAFAQGPLVVNVHAIGTVDTKAVDLALLLQGQ